MDLPTFAYEDWEWGVWGYQGITGYPTETAARSALHDWPDESPHGDPMLVRRRVQYDAWQEVRRA